MYEKKTIIKNEVGLHARPASLFIQEACKYTSDIFVTKTGKTYNAKSIMSILSMGAKKGDEILIFANGEDEKEAVENLCRFLEDNVMNA